VRDLYSAKVSEENRGAIQLVGSSSLQKCRLQNDL